MTSFKSISELCNVVSMAAYCTDDATMLITLEGNSSEFWVPSAKVVEGDSWQSQLNREMKDIFEKELQNSKLLNIYKIWLPDQPMNWIYHCVYAVTVKDESKRKSKATKGKYRGKIRWVTEMELVKMWIANGLRSPEVYKYFLALREHQDSYADSSEQEKVNKAVEYIQRGKLIEIGREVFVDKGKSIYEQLVESAGFTVDFQKHLYREFVFLCFPCVYMSQQVFARTIMELGWLREDSAQAFSAADVANRFGLSFREFLYILAAIDPNTSHGGGPAELRCRYIFRFFDQDKDGILSLAEFRALIAFMRKSKSLPPDLVELMKDADGIYKNLGFSSNMPLTLSAFLLAVGSLKIRGTSHTFRSTRTAQQYLQSILKREAKFKVIESSADKKAITVDFGQKKVENKVYELAVHTVRLQKSATLINVEELWNLDTALSQTALKIVQASSPESNRRFSMAVFNQASQCNELLKSLRYLQQLNKVKTYSKTPLFSWGHLDQNTFAQHLIKVCQEVTAIFKKESRLLELSSPIYIMGDLHGNIADLIYFEKVFWHLGPCLCPCSLLFLGDYVDRGSYGIEVVTYLFCYKIQSPAKVYMLRGNHEIRDIQKMFSFQAECLSKFGEKTGNNVWEAINNAFDCMPLAATIDGKIFCCHGGIPPPWLCPVVSTINQIPTPLNKPDQQCSLAWEIMWNDPVKKSAMTDNIVMELMANDGFAANYRRGTAHVFSVEALERFLNTNSFSHIIRAHEVAQSGFNVQQKAKLLTVFSSSKYCGGQNEAACILADQGKLRVLRIETG